MPNRILRATLASLVITACSEASGDPRDAGPGGGKTDGVADTTIALGAIPATVGVEFGVWAPHADRVFVAGTWNDWETSADELERAADGTFGGAIPDADVGDRYKYVIQHGGDALWRSDPRARVLVEDQNFDGIIVDPEAFAWTDAGFEPPSFREQVIYELHIPSFTTDPSVGHGTFRSAIGRIDHLVDLGINVVELMPVHENPGGNGWGYGPISMFAVERGYGSPDDLKAFIDAAHANDIAVVLDWVPNHMLEENVMRDYDGDSLGAKGIYFYPDERGTTPWGPRPDYRAPQVRDWLVDDLTLWLDEYHFDGTRTDSTIAMGRSPVGDLPEAWSLMQTWNDMVDTRWPRKIMIAEDLQNSDWINRRTHDGGAGFDAQWDEDLFWALYEAVRTSDDTKRDVARVASAITHGYLDEATHRVVYTENHDKVPSDRQQRMPRAVSASDPHDYWARKRSTLAAAVLLTSPGIPMLFQGQEFLEVAGFDFPVAPPLDWRNKETFAGILAMYRDLIAMRTNEHGATRGLMGNHTVVHHRNDSDKVIAYHRWDQGGPGDDVLVVANFSNRSFDSYLVGLPRGGTWKVRFHGDAKAYSPDFGGGSGTDVVAEATGRDGMTHRGSVVLRPYSVVVLSQDR